MRRIISSRAAFSFLFVTLGSLSFGHAEHLVTFTRGQSIVVQSAEKRGNWYYFVLDGGGEMGVPASRVAHIEEYEAPPAPAVAPGTASTAAAPPAVPPSSGQPSADPASSAQAAPPSNVAPVANPDDGNQNQDSRANTMARGDDWRYRAKMSGGPRVLDDGPGGIRRMGQGNRPMGGRGGYLGQPGAPGSRRPPFYQQQQQQQQNNPPQQ
jgi:hypothetical protein